MTLEQNLRHSAEKKGLSGEEEEHYVGGAIENMRKRGKLPNYGFKRGRKPKSEPGSGDRYEEKKAERAKKREQEAEKYKKQREEVARKEQEYKNRQAVERMEKEQARRDIREFSNVRRRVHGMVQTAKKYYPDVEAEGKRLVEAGKLKGDESTMTKKDYDAWIRFFKKHKIYT